MTFGCRCAIEQPLIHLFWIVKSSLQMLNEMSSDALPDSNPWIQTQLQPGRHRTQSGSHDSQSSGPGQQRNSRRYSSEPSVATATGANRQSPPVDGQIEDDDEYMQPAPAAHKHKHYANADDGVLSVICTVSFVICHLSTCITSGL